MAFHNHKRKTKSNPFTTACSILKLVISLRIVSFYANYLHLHVTAESIPIPFAIVINDPFYHHLDQTFSHEIVNNSGLLPYTPIIPYDRAFIFGQGLVQKQIFDMGGIIVNNKTFYLDQVLYNLAKFNGSMDQFVNYVHSGGQGKYGRPLAINTYLATTQEADDLLVIFARKCLTPFNECVMIPGSPNKNIYVCTDDLILSGVPECVGRNGLRRFNNIFSSMPDSDYIAESFIGHMAFKQQRTMAVLASGSSFTPSALDKTSTIAPVYGIDVIYSDFITNEACNAARISHVISNIKAKQPDFLVIMGIATDAVCWVDVLTYMKKSDVDYFPKAVAFMGGLLEGMIGFMQMTGQDPFSLLNYVYGVKSIDEKNTGNEYNAISTLVHTELFPTINTTSSGLFFHQLYRSTYGEEEGASLFLTSAYYGASLTLIALQMFELSGGILNANNWISVSSQINEPSIIGQIQMDPTGRNLGSRHQIINQIHGFSSSIVSSSSRFQDTFPAPVWSARLYRTYLMAGDIMEPYWGNPTYVLLGVATLFFSRYSGIFLLRTVVKQHAKTSSISIVQIIFITISFGIAGYWAFYLICFQGIKFKPVDQSVRTNLSVYMPMSTTFLSLLWCIPVAFAVYFYILTNKKLRVFAEKIKVTKIQNNTNSIGNSEIKSSYQLNNLFKADSNETVIEFVAMRDENAGHTNDNKNKNNEDELQLQLPIIDEQLSIVKTIYVKIIYRLASLPKIAWLYLFINAFLWTISPFAIQCMV